MSLLRRSPSACEAPRCGRLAAVRLSNGPDAALSCHLHVARWERLWGQVWVVGIPARAPRRFGR